MNYRTITATEAAALAKIEDADFYPVATVNEVGLNEIHEFLAARHKLGRDHFDKAMLRAWAADAEFQIGEGNTPSIEIKSWDSVSGSTEEFTISDAGIDWSILDAA